MRNSGAARQQRRRGVAVQQRSGGAPGGREGRSIRQQRRRSTMSTTILVYYLDFFKNTFRWRCPLTSIHNKDCETSLRGYLLLGVDSSFAPGDIG